MSPHVPPGVSHPYALPPRARQTTWLENRKESLKKFPQGVETALCALAHGHGKDHMLGRLNDVSRTAGVASIAGLGSLGVNQPGASVPLWLGGASWLGAMAITPRVIDGAVYLKSGMNRGIKYLSSTGEVRPLFLDPNYMPIQVVPQEKQEALAHRWGIPPNHPDLSGLLQAKLKKISVQAFTWWMLMAGMATPVIAALLCNRIEEPLKDRISRFRQWYAHTAMESALKSGDPKRITRSLERSIHASIGSGTEMTVLSRWWSRFPKSVIRALGLNKLSQQELLHPSEEFRFNRVVRHLDEMLLQENSRRRLETLLGQEQDRLRKIFQPHESLLNHRAVKGNVPASTLAAITQRLQLAKDTAEATLQNLKQLLHLPLKGMPRDKARAILKQRMEKAVLSYIEQLNRAGEISRASQIAGGSGQFRNIMTSFTRSQFAPAFKQVGDSPKSFILRALNSMALGKRWLKRFPGYIGGGMILGTALFTLFALGKDFDSPASQRRPQS